MISPGADQILDYPTSSDWSRLSDKKAFYQIDAGSLTNYPTIWLVSPLIISLSYWQTGPSTGDWYSGRILSSLIELFLRFTIDLCIDDPR